MGAAATRLLAENNYVIWISTEDRVAETSGLGHQVLQGLFWVGGRDLRLSSIVVMSASVQITTGVNTAVHHQSGCGVDHAIRDVIIALGVRSLQFTNDKPTEHCK